VTGVQISNDRRTIVYRLHDILRAMDAQGDLPEEGDEPQKPPDESGRKSGLIDLDRIGVEVIPKDEWAQMYGEAWRLQTEQPTAVTFSMRMCPLRSR